MKYLKPASKKSYGIMEGVRQKTRMEKKPAADLPEYYTDRR